MACLLDSLTDLTSRRCLQYTVKLNTTRELVLQSAKLNITVRLAC